MKKKLNLLWNLKFNFFSVAERPLTFFAYFLNAKKVGRRRLVIGPAKAGAFLFSHTRLPLSPRPLLPFGRISPAAKPGWPVVAPAGGNVLAPPFSLRSNVAPRSHPGPCSRSVAFRLRRNRAGRSSAPPFGFAAQNQARHFTPRNRAAGYRPHLLGLPRKIGRGISLRETTLGGRPLRGHGFAAPHRHFPLPATAAPPNGIRLLFSDKYEQKA